MTKQFKGINLLIGLVAVIASIGIGEIFVSGQLASNTIILKYLPLIVHQITGWVIIGSGVLGVLKIFGFIR